MIKIPDNVKKKVSELFEIDGIMYRVEFLPKGAMNKLEDWLNKFAHNVSHAMTMEYATSLNHTGIDPTDFVSAEEAVKKYIDFINVCILYMNREMMEKAIRSALKKKNGTFMVNRVQHLAFTGLSVNFKFYELCAVNETENVMVLEMRSVECSHRYLPPYQSCKTCQDILREAEAYAKENNIKFLAI